MQVKASLVKLLLAAVLTVPLMLGMVTPAAAAGVPTWHTVVQGETLFSIGRLYDVNPWAIASANYLPNPNRIYVGQYLYVPAGPSYPWPHPCGSYYTVQCGDTLFRIGRIYGVSPWSIAAANGIYNMNYIRAGQRLFIPCR